MPCKEEKDLSQSRQDSTKLTYFLCITNHFHHEKKTRQRHLLVHKTVEAVFDLLEKALRAALDGFRLWFRF